MAKTLYTLEKYLSLIVEMAITTKKKKHRKTRKNISKRKGQRTITRKIYNKKYQRGGYGGWSNPNIKNSGEFVGIQDLNPHMEANNTYVQILPDPPNKQTMELVSKIARALRNEKNKKAARNAEYARAAAEWAAIRPEFRKLDLESNNLNNSLVNKQKLLNSARRAQAAKELAEYHERLGSLQGHQLLEAQPSTVSHRGPLPDIPRPGPKTWLNIFRRKTISHSGNPRAQSRGPRRMTVHL